MIYLPLSLIPLCALLNHLGGQSTYIPCPRITSRVFGITTAFYAVAALQLPLGTALEAAGIVLAGMALWAVPGWASGFSCIGNCEDGRQDTALANFINCLMGLSSLDKLSQKQCWNWGVLYFTLRGLYIYPLFAGLGYLLTPWAYLIGLAGVLQGVLYGTSSLVLWAEYKMGALIGLMLAAVLMV